MSGAVRVRSNGGVSTPDQYAPVDTLQPVAVPDIIVPAGRELLTRWWTTTGTGSSDLKVVEFGALRIPSSGLTVESFETIVQVFATGSASPVTSGILPSMDLRANTIDSLYGMRSGRVAVSVAVREQFHDCIETCTTVVVDPEKPSVTASFPGQMAYVSDDRIITSKQERVGLYCAVAEAYDVASSRRIWRYDSPAARDTQDCRAPYVLTTPDNGQYSAKYVEIEYKRAVVLLDADSGKPVQPAFENADSIALDPVGDYALVVNSNLTDDPVAYYVADVATGRRVYSVTVKQRMSLGIRDSPRLFGNLLYATTSDGKPVIDVNTSASLTQQAQAAPTGTLGATWVVTTTPSQTREAARLTSKSWPGPKY